MFTGLFGNGNGSESSCGPCHALDERASSTGKHNATTYTKEQVARYNNEADGHWLIIHNKVYDCTTYLSDHPGGSELITERSGGDATEGFENHFHSKRARALLETLYVGDVLPEQSEEGRKLALPSTDGPESELVGRVDQDATEDLGSEHTPRKSLPKLLEVAMARAASRRRNDESKKNSSLRKFMVETTTNSQERSESDRYRAGTPNRNPGLERTRDNKVASSFLDPFCDSDDENVVDMTVSPSSSSSSHFDNGDKQDTTKRNGDTSPLALFQTAQPSICSPRAA